MRGYSYHEERRALDRMLADIRATGDQPDPEGLAALVIADALSDAADSMEASVIAGMTPERLRARVERQRAALAPHGLCPECGEPLSHEPDSVEPIEFWGARGTHVLRGGLYCADCGLRAERGAA